MTKILLAVLFAGALSAQTVTVKFQGPFCQPAADGTPQVLAFIGTPLLPACLRIGAGLRVNMGAAGGPALEFRTDVQISAIVPTQVTETFSLKGVAGPTKDIVLKYGPAPNSVILLIYQDIPTVALSLKTLQVNSAATPISGNVLRIEIPDHSDSADVTILYSTFSGCAPDRPNNPGCQ